MKERDEALDAVKGFAIIIVMLGHCISWNHMQDHILYDFIVAVQMPLFFAVSGYIAGMSKPIISVQRVGEIARKRVIAYLLPFFSWIVLTQLLNRKNPLPEMKLVLWKLDSGLWFLMTLFLITMITVLAEYITNKVFVVLKKELDSPGHMCFFSVLILIVWCAFILQARNQNPTIGEFLSPSLTITHMPFYIGAYLVSRYIRVWWKDWAKSHGLFLKKGLNILWGIALLLLLINIILFDLQGKETIKDVIVLNMSSMLGVFVCFYGVYEIYKKKKEHPKYGLSFLGLYTLEIYALHFRFATILGFANKKLSLYSRQGIGALFLIFTTMSLLTGICIWLIKRFRILDFLLFGKQKY